MQSFLESAAVDLGTAGKDNLYGSGRLDLGPLPPDAPSGLTANAVSSIQIDLSWTDNSDDETGFKIEKKTGSGGTYAQIGTVGAGVTNYSSTSLGPSTTYYYRVRAYNGTSNSDYCDEASATTLLAPPLAPVLASPANGATVPTLTPRLQWNVVAGASDYGIQVATASTFASPVINETGITDLYYDVPPSVLNWSTTYYWRVNAHNSAGTSAWSTYRSFKTGIGPAPDAPSDLVATPVSSKQIDLTWQDNSINESSFKIERKTGVGGTYALVGTVGAAVTSYSNTALTASTTYYYRVRAWNPTGYSAYCAEASATTLPPPPPKPTLASPAGGALVSTLTPRLQWNASSGASDYGIQVSTTSTFAVLLVDETDITDLFFDVPPGTLSASTRYYWRVNASGASGSTSLWSSYRYFRTPAGP
jgi:titin